MNGNITTNLVEKFKNKYNAKTTRLQSWDGYYFITICTKNRQNFFGRIENKKMFLNEFGEIAKEYWSEIPNHFKNAQLDAFVIMPNHVHGIVIIDNNNDLVDTPNLGVSTKCQSGNLGVSTKWRSGNLGVIINQYKRICTIALRKINKNFAWQSRFYDHIIRNEKSLNNIRQYIIDNPLKWDLDKNNLHKITLKNAFKSR